MKYDKCPKCGNTEGLSRERRLHGYSYCSCGHKWRPKIKVLSLLVDGRDYPIKSESISSLKWALDADLIILKPNVKIKEEYKDAIF